MTTDEEGCAILIAAIVGIVIAFFVLVYVVLPVAAVIAGLGATWGGGHALVNYVQALRDNVSFERARSSP